jgi:hypothetical protein
MTAVEHIELHPLSPTSSPINNNVSSSNDDDSTATTQDGNKKSSNQKQVVRRSYLSLCGVAILLTILTPRSKLWMSSSSCRNAVQHPSSQRGNSTKLYERLDNSSTRSLGESSSSTRSKQQQQQDIQGSCIYFGSLNMQILIIPTIWIITLIISFIYLQGSNPGVLTKEIIERLDALDGGENNCAEDENNEMNNNDDLERRTFLEPPTPSSSPSPLDLTTKSDVSVSQNKHSNTLYRSTRRKYCDKCQFYPPLRSHHCSTCNACIATFDHHCDFLGTCIGERNHWRFWWFLVLNVVTLKICLDIVNSSSLTLSAFVYGQGSNASSSNDDDLKLGLGTAIRVTAKLYMYPIFLITSMLLTIHTLLQIGNVTTFEFTKGAEHIDYLTGTRTMDFTFGRGGLCKNIIMFFRRDDVYRSLCLRSKGNIDYDGSKMSMDDRWVPVVWKMPEFIDRESAEWWRHPLENKYWQCC